jgi:Short C-terminal domain
MPGPMRRTARTAAVAGTAAHVAGKHQAEKDAQAAAATEPQAPAPVAAAPVGMTDEKMAQLERLGQLKADGVLTEEEFAQQKAAILGG